MGTDRVLRYLANLPEGISEIYFHPALGTWPDVDKSTKHGECDQEFRALTSPRIARALRDSGIRPIAFSDLANQLGRLE
jgi:hypothetical protein